ncbi:hypothetical protein LUZ60_008241 [Juncus effusus]|nr:hypothetical protein LUZ60_008241 [Juncus effusus]
MAALFAARRSLRFPARYFKKLVLVRTATNSSWERIDPEFSHDSNEAAIYGQNNTNQQGYYQNNTYNQGLPYQVPHFDQFNQGANNGNSNYAQYGYNSSEFNENSGVYYRQNDASPKNRVTIEELMELCNEGKIKDAIQVLVLLEENKIEIGIQNYNRLIKACGDASDLESAKIIHNQICKNITNGELTVSLNNKILDMYIKCDSIDDAQKLFDEMPQRNLTSWETMILGLAKKGQGEEALDLFYRLKKTDLPLDDGIFSCAFFSCGVVGDVNEGMLHLKSMEENYKIAPTMQTYNSIVDMLGQAGYLEEALEFIEQMSLEPSMEIWETLMRLSILNGHVDLGKRCISIIETLDPSKLDEKSKLGFIPINPLDLEREKAKQKKTGTGLLGHTTAREYRAGDRSDPESDKIYALLRQLSSQMKEMGHIPDTRFVLHDIDQESKEEALLAHSERLAAAYAFMTSPPRAPIRIIKNLRCCGDCHNALKLISTIVGREITARDAKRFHCFKNGVCTCNDYW